MDISMAYAEFVKFLIRRGFKDLKNHPGCLYVEIDRNWSAVFNPHMQPDDHNGTKVGAYEVHIKFRKTPVGVVGPYGGAIIADTKGSAEDDFINAVKAAS